MAARSLLVLVVVMLLLLLHFLSFFLFCQAEKEPVGPFLCPSRLYRNQKGKLREREREKVEGVKIENNGLGLVYRHSSRPNRYVRGNP